MFEAVRGFNSSFDVVCFGSCKPPGLQAAGRTTRLVEGETRTRMRHHLTSFVFVFVYLCVYVSDTFASCSFNYVYEVPTLSYDGPTIMPWLSSLCSFRRFFFFVINGVSHVFALVYLLSGDEGFHFHSRVVNLSVCFFSYFLPLWQCTRHSQQSRVRRSIFYVYCYNWIPTRGNFLILEPRLSMHACMHACVHTSVHAWCSLTSVPKWKLTWVG